MILIWILLNRCSTSIGVDIFTILNLPIQDQNEYKDVHCLLILNIALNVTRRVRQGKERKGKRKTVYIYKWHNVICKTFNEAWWLLLLILALDKRISRIIRTARLNQKILKMFFKELLQVRQGAHTINPSIQEADTGGSL